MPKIIQTEKLPRNLTYSEKRYVYNGLDCCITRGVFDAVELDPDQQRVYKAEQNLQAATMQMQLRGINVDHEARDTAIYQLEKETVRYRTVLERLAAKHLGWCPNIQSGPQLIQLFYNKRNIDVCDICAGEGRYQDGYYKNGNPRIRKCPRIKDHEWPGVGEKHIANLKSKQTPKPASVDVDAMEKIRNRNAHGSLANMLARCVIGFRNAKKQLDFLSARLSPDMRMRASFNVGATETFRLSSSTNVFGEGTNFQNVTSRRRNIFIPDEGYRMCYVDLAQGESHFVAYASGDPEYMRVHDEPGNTHLKVARLIWPDELPDNEEEALAIAKHKGFFRHHSMYDLSKRIQHGANYVGTKYTVARTLQIKQKEAQEILDKYHSRFPGIHKWHAQIKEQLRETGMLTIPGFNVSRRFFERPWSKETLREGVAFIPQGAIALICHIGVWRIWKHLDGKHLEPVDDLQILQHGHDACLFQYREGREDLRDRAAELMRVTVPMPNGNLTLGVDIEEGPNWRDMEEI